MNCEPCNSLEVVCNHNVTIGYLKELVANIPTECCTTITVTGDNSYCPTYGELMNGSIIPVYVGGAANAWSNNVDGIAINATYSSNQCVAKKDLTLIYTAFESLRVANSSPTVSECGGSTTTTRTLTFRKYVKECDKAPTSTTSTDTTLSVTWYGTNSSSTGTKTYSRNTSFSDTHSSTVSCSINWRGCTYASNSVIVSQKVRAFDHYNDYSRCSGDSLDVTCYPATFDCRGGTSYARATYYYTTWTERHSIDTCGIDYAQNIVNKVSNNTRDVSSSLNATSHTYSCEPATCTSSMFTFRATYTDPSSCDIGSGSFTDSDTCCMECPGCGPCPPAPYTSYTDVTASCEDLSATVNGTIHTFSGGERDGEGHCVNYTETTTPTSYTVTWTCDTAGGWVDSHVYVEGAPCCASCSDLSLEGGTTKTWASDSTSPVDITIISASSVSSISLSSLNYFTATLGANKVTIAPTGTNEGTSAHIETLTISYKAGKLDCSVNVSLTQQGKVCQCSDLTLGSASESWTYNDTSYKYVAITATAVCITNISVSNNLSHFNVSIENGQVKINPKAINNTENEYNETCVVSYKASGTDCSKNIALRQGINGCVCGDLILGSNTATWTYNSTSATDISITSGECITDISKSSLTNFNATFGANKITVSPKNVNNSCTALSENLIISYKAGDTKSCTSAITLTQNAMPCTCSDLTVGKTSESWAYDSTTAKDITITSAVCINSISAPSTTSHFNVSLGANKVTVTPRNTNIGETNYVDTLVVSYKACSTDCSSAITLTQSGMPCTCADLVASPTAITWPYTATTSDTRNITISSAVCINSISVPSTTSHFNVSLGTNSITVAPKGQNTTFTNYVDTLNISYKYHSTSCTSSITLTQESNACQCSDVTVASATVTFTCDYYSSRVFQIPITSASCVTNLAVTHTQPDTASTVFLGDGCINLDIESPNYSDRDWVDNITLTYNDNCSIPITITQKKAGCNDIYTESVFDDEDNKNYWFPLNEATTWFDIGWVAGPSMITASTSGTHKQWNDIITFVRGEDMDVMFDDWRVSDGRLQRMVRAKPLEVFEQKLSNIYITVNGVECKAFTIRRACPCGLDDCVHDFGNGEVLDYGLPADAWQLCNSNTTCVISGKRYSVRYGNAGSLNVPYTSLSALTINGWEQLQEGHITEVDGAYFITSGWSGVTNEGVWITYDRNYGGMIYYLVPNNYSYNARTFTVHYSAAPGTIITKGYYAGQYCCSKFDVHIFQAPNAGHYQRTSDTKRDKKGQVVRYLRPITSGDWPDIDRESGYLNTPPPSYRCGIEEMNQHGVPNEDNPLMSPPYMQDIPNKYRKITCDGTCKKLEDCNNPPS